MDQEEGTASDIDEEVAESPNWQPGAAGPRVHLGVLELAPGQSYRVEGSACEEVIIYISTGRVQDGGAVRTEGTLLRTQDRVALTALEPSRLVVALVTAPSDDCVLMDDVVRHRTAGQSVDLMLPPDGGTYGTFALFDDPPSAMHTNPMDEAFLVEGEGVLVLRHTDGHREEQALIPGQAVHIPAGTPYTLGNTSNVFRLYQVLTLAAPAADSEGDKTEALGIGRPDSSDTGLTEK